MVERAAPVNSPCGGRPGFGLTGLRNRLLRTFTLMETTSNRSTLFSLFRTLTSDTKELIRQEVRLATTEISEKISTMGRNASMLAVGGFVAYAGVIVLFVGLGWLAGYALQEAGFDAALANGLGIGGVGLVVAVVGVGLLFKPLNTLRQTSLAPERTMHTLQELRGIDRQEDMEYALAHAGGSEAIEEEQAAPSSEELQFQVEQTEDRMGQTLDELGRRLSPSHIKMEVSNRISAKPYHFGLGAMAAGLLTGLLLGRRLFPGAR